MQDLVENLFSVIRSKHVSPNVLQFKYDLHSISIAQYVKPISSSNYDYDGSPYLIDFLDAKTLDKRVVQPKSGEITISNACSTTLHDFASQPLQIVDMSPLQIKPLQNLENNGLYRAAGYSLPSIQKIKMRTCSKCIQSVRFRENTLFFRQPSNISNVPGHGIYFVSKRAEKVALHACA